MDPSMNGAERIEASLQGLSELETDRKVAKLKVI
jgi:hypothetical protein